MVQDTNRQPMTECPTEVEVLPQDYGLVVHCAGDDNVIAMLGFPVG